jgi:hypothetical protein
MTVEELRERLRYVTPSAWYGVIDEIISASHAEGVAEGEEREKAKIQKRLAASHAEGVAEGEEREKAKIQKRLEAAWESLYPESGVTIDIHESERAKKRHASVLAPKEKP